MTTVKIQWQDFQGRWQHYGTYHHEPSAFRYAQQIAKRTGKRHRLVDGDGHLLDLVDP
jgi:hypothetical protein